MDIEVLDALDDVKYEKKFDETSLFSLLDDWTEYSKVIEWICASIQAVSKLDEVVNAIGPHNDLAAFQMELSSFLKELGYGRDYKHDEINGSTAGLALKFDTKEKRLLVLHFLLHELLASRILYARSSKEISINLEESKEAKILSEIILRLQMSKPPDNISPQILCSKIEEKVSSINSHIKSHGISTEAMFIGVLNDSQWDEINVLNEEFQNEYKTRREMLLKRLDVTVQSFTWSERLASQVDTIASIFKEKRHNLCTNPNICVSDLLAARTDLAYIEKTSSASVRKNTKSAVNSVVIGKVPDRGGRPTETEAPAPEMPQWQQRQSGSVGWAQKPRGGGRGGRGNNSSRGDQNERDSRNPSWYNDSQQQSHYSSNEGWNQRGGRSGNYATHDQQQFQNQQFQSQDYRGGRGRGQQKSRVQGGWSGY